MSFVQHEHFKQFWPAEAVPATGNLFLLIDAAAQTSGLHRLRFILPAGERCSLFEDTPEQNLHDLAPWLIHIDPSYLQSDAFLQLLKIEYETASLSWIWTPLNLKELQKTIQPFMQAQLKSGQEALVRIYDPPVLLRLIKTFTPEQEKKLMGQIQAWWLYDAHHQIRHIIKPLN
ncbi:DUF4123 domain-containing protein [Janthinobacterium sp. B9-8]|uniref:DUF4123 domain-containing protein n=1 Tax=Janthinobacterium sp. B9-8 TaxID=1236179 RepID=UPI00061CE238|nr:DUF4123 domain-containing protein [Janthinobacterium sp. B9-8]AMC35304.1 hypothetical protein VN23_12140 [Janthinobacterium sp. B9-8]